MNMETTVLCKIHLYQLTAAVREGSLEIAKKNPCFQINILFTMINAEYSDKM